MRTLVVWPTVFLAHVASSSIAIVSPERPGAVLPFGQAYLAVGVNIDGRLSARQPRAVGAWLSAHVGAIVITTGKMDGILEATWCGEEPGVLEGPLSLQTDADKLRMSSDANERLYVGGFATVSSD